MTPMQTSDPQHNDGLGSSPSGWEAVGHRIRDRVGRWRRSTTRTASSAGLDLRYPETNPEESQAEYDNFVNDAFPPDDISPEPAQSAKSEVAQRYPIEQSIPYLQIINRTPSPTPKKLGDTSFKYHKLDPRGDEFRLLRILPNKSSIECEIFHVWLPRLPDYVAISYAWGDLDDTWSITLNGHDFPITISLWQILHRVRSTLTAVTVWADAICIDQVNPNERNQQVKMMATIYKLATSVAAWLGPEYGNSQLGIDLLEELVNAYDGNHPSHCERILKSPEWTRAIIALGDVFDRQYWYRLWKVQELFNARQTHVYCGSAKIPLSALFTVSKILKENNHVLLSLRLQNYGTATFQHDLSGVLRRPMVTTIPKKEVSLLVAIRSTDMRFCEDPRDKIYGVLGLVTAQERGLILADYNLTKQQVYLNAVQHIITTTKRLDVLCRPILLPQGVEYKPRGVAGALPTWLPDFSIPGTTSTFRSWDSLFDASRGTDAVVAFFGRQQKIQVLAVHIDSIRMVGTTLRPRSSEIDVILVFLNWCSDVFSKYGIEEAAIQRMSRLLRLGVQSEVPSDLVSDRQWMCMILGVIKRQFTNSKLRLSSLAMNERLSALGCGVEDMLGFDDQTVLYLLRRTMTGRRFCITKSGIFVIMAGEISSKAEIYVLLGASLPVMLEASGDEYSYIGEACVDGYMFGRAIDELDSGTRELESIVLV